jgi:hypothetical protein
VSYGSEGFGHPHDVQLRTGRRPTYNLTDLIVSPIWPSPKFLEIPLVICIPGRSCFLDISLVICISWEVLRAADGHDPDVSEISRDNVIESS